MKNEDTLSKLYSLVVETRRQVQEKAQIQEAV